MIIETERLILRPFLETDAADVYEYLKEEIENNKINQNNKYSK